MGKILPFNRKSSPPGAPQSAASPPPPVPLRPPTPIQLRPPTPEQRIKNLEQHAQRVEDQLWRMAEVIDELAYEAGKSRSSLDSINKWILLHFSPKQSL